MLFVSEFEIQTPQFYSDILTKKELSFSRLPNIKKKKKLAKVENEYI